MREASRPVIYSFAAGSDTRANAANSVAIGGNSWERCGYRCGVCQRGRHQWRRHRQRGTSRLNRYQRNRAWFCRECQWRQRTCIWQWLASSERNERHRDRHECGVGGELHRDGTERDRQWLHQCLGLWRQRFGRRDRQCRHRQHGECLRCHLHRHRREQHRVGVRVNRRRPRRQRGTATNASAFGQGASATASNSVALGAGSVASVANAVSVGAVGSERKIINVAAGTLSSTSTDAVNGSQLVQRRRTSRATEHARTSTRWAPPPRRHLAAAPAIRQATGITGLSYTLNGSASHLHQCCRR